MDKTGITIEEVLAIPILRNARVLAGSQGLNRVVQFIDVMEVPDLKGWVKEGVLMLTTAYAIRDNPSELAGLIRVLDQGGGAALAIKPARFLKGIPQDALDASDETGLPLIEVPSEIPYTDITRPIMERVLDRQAALLRRSEEVYRTLTTMVLQNSGIQAVSDNVAGLLRAPVAVIDNEGELIVSSPAGQAWDLSRTPLEWAINVDRRNVARLLVDKKELDEMELVGIEQARLVLALELMRNKIVADTEMRLRGNFIDELLTPPVPPRHEVEQRARKLGLNVEHLWEVAVIEGEWAAGEEELLTRRLEEEARIRRVSPHVEFRSNRAVLFLPSMEIKRVEDNRNRLMPWADTLEGWASDKLPGLTGSRIGLGGQKRLWEIYDSYNEARKALNVSRRIGQGRFVIRYEEVEIYDLLGNAMEGPEFAELFNRKLGKLRQYDEEHNGDLMRTFLYYLESRGSLIDTSNRLFIHRNSVKYRLERIRDITGFDLNDSREQLVCQLCLIYYYMRVNPVE
ncbi:PucR family transcriptional regulator [Paenibacillus durus]|uniref:Polyketide synthase regulator n=1 Tax=Paenibacillus durus TaxID=44251 RepID=A0A089HKB7_PAEDU|nr:PucR family transcriptional regulator [Paenibacillus durus]AIQ10828.1 polyketide synthase regulator [Paenibacillus durus]